jgi:hypothetical protein
VWRWIDPRGGRDDARRQGIAFVYLDRQTIFIKMKE